jgi:Sulfotransferase domain
MQRSNMGRPKLQFVIGGAQKAGTTTLDAIFRMHPKIQMAATKETHFFDDETLDWQNPPYDKLDAYFSGETEKVCGEATPITLFWRPAIQRLHRYNPDTKFVLLLRNPVERAFSQWRHEYAGGRETLPFNEAIREVGRSRLATSGENDPERRVFSYVERGFYAKQLRYLMQYFPVQNIHCEISEDLFHDQAPVLQRLSVFLGIEDFSKKLPKVHAYAGREIAYPSEIQHDDRTYLSGLFRGDIAALEAILGRTIPQW